MMIRQRNASQIDRQFALTLALFTAFYVTIVVADRADDLKHADIVAVQAPAGGTGW